MLDSILSFVLLPIGIILWLILLSMIMTTISKAIVKDKSKNE